MLHPRRYVYLVTIVYLERRAPHHHHHVVHVRGVSHSAVLVHAAGVHAVVHPTAVHAIVHPAAVAVHRTIHTGAVVHPAAVHPTIHAYGRFHVHCKLRSLSNPL